MELYAVLAKELKLAQSSGVKERCGSDHNHRRLGLFLSTLVRRENFYFPQGKLPHSFLYGFQFAVMLCLCLKDFPDEKVGMVAEASESSWKIR